PDLILVRTDFTICARWHGRGRPSRLTRFDVDPLGKSPGRIVLHSESVARPSPSPRKPPTPHLPLVACRTRRQCCHPTLVFVGIRLPTFHCNRRGLDRLLFGLLHRIAHPNHPP